MHPNLVFSLSLERHLFEVALCELLKRTALRFTKEQLMVKLLSGTFYIAAVFFFWVIPSIAQEPLAQPGVWRGLAVDVSTTEDAIRILGPAVADKPAQKLKLELVDKWLPGAKFNQKIFRQLKFKKVADFDEVQLSFLDNKLVLIELSAHFGDVPDWIDPDDLPTTFNAKFIYTGWHFGKKLAPLAEFEMLDGTPPKKFAELYDMIAITDRCFIVARVDNIEARGMSLFGPPCTSCARQENNKRKQRDSGGKFPGQVTFIDIVSRKLGDAQSPTAAP